MSTTAGETNKQSATIAKPALLAGGNPQIPKAEGDAPVQEQASRLPGERL